MARKNNATIDSTLAQLESDDAVLNMDDAALAEALGIDTSDIADDTDDAPVPTPAPKARKANKFSGPVAPAPTPVTDTPDTSDLDAQIQHLLAQKREQMQGAQTQTVTATVTAPATNKFGRPTSPAAAAPKPVKEPSELQQINAIADPQVRFDAIKAAWAVAWKACPNTKDAAMELYFRFAMAFGYKTMGAVKNNRTPKSLKPEA